MRSEANMRVNHLFGTLLSVSAVLVAVASLFKLNEPAYFFTLSFAALAISVLLLGYSVKDRGLATAKRHYFTVGMTVAILMVLATMFKFSIMR